MEIDRYMTTVISAKYVCMSTCLDSMLYMVCIIVHFSSVLYKYWGTGLFDMYMVCIIVHYSSVLYKYWGTGLFDKISHLHVQNGYTVRMYKYDIILVCQVLEQTTNT